MKKTLLEQSLINLAKLSGQTLSESALADLVASVETEDDSKKPEVEEQVEDGKFVLALKDKTTGKVVGFYAGDDKEVTKEQKDAVSFVDEKEAKSEIRVATKLVDHDADETEFAVVELATLTEDDMADEDDMSDDSEKTDEEKVEEGFKALAAKLVDADADAIADMLKKVYDAGVQDGKDADEEDEEEDTSK